MVDSTISPVIADRITTWPAAQKVVIVNGSPDMTDLFESVLSAGHYDIVFVESSEHAYSQIKRVQPNLVVLCLEIDDCEGLHVLSMLKLDKETRDIPVLTYTTTNDHREEEEEEETGSAADFFAAPKPAFSMN